MTTGAPSRPDAPAPQEPHLLYAGARGTAVKVLNRVERTDSYLDKVLDTELKSTDLSDLDKGLLTEIVHGVLRWQNRLDWILNGFSHGSFAKAEINLKNAMRVALYQILFLDRVPHPAAVNEAVEFVKRIRGEKPAGLVNAVLRNIIRNIDGIRYPDPVEDEVQYLAVYYSQPHWVVKRWLPRFGPEETRALLQASNERPALTLRINQLKTDIPTFLAKLDEQQISYTGSAYIPYVLRTRGLTRIGQMELFRTGMFTIQDESAALPSILMDPKPGERVIDLCAAPGGKTTHLAELMGNRGDILAVDKYAVKLNQLKGACDRLGVGIVRFLEADGAALTVDQPVDRVLLDAPCTGLGVLSKKPDMKWKRETSDLIRVTALQARLMDNAATLVRPGGVLVYSTCTTEPEENTLMVRAFLERHPEFSHEDARGLISSDLVNAEGFVETLPHKHGMDGSFAARLVRRADA
ncbi:MAG: Ribosomal small subunit methyltransferase [Bacteroidetes bacterium]|nr:Ribosomal small subunit methyltransferase [Bacteroidota bacterium]